ncbi:hypothetical protein BJX68DRAFT_255806 [Aspergillus pseudodeflectus]|uniref:BHLH domain-containing protein n=1 Tax=Aspergillus pseudodeflectus TaxID=176178 RepID=A0ABR4KBV8_9EURO
MSHVLHNLQPTPTSSAHRTPYPRIHKRKFVEIRPKGAVVSVARENSTESRRRQHADAQKCQRDRMKAALDQIARIMEMGGVDEKGLSGTKAMLLETAVEYIRYLQEQVEELRESSSSSSSGHATPRVESG